MTRRSIAAALLLASAARAAAPAALDGGRYGEVRLLEPKGAVRAYVVLFSDRGGWKPSDAALLAALARAGAVAVGVDLDAYLGRIANSNAPCDQLVGDVESLSRQLQRRARGGEYYFPILAGTGAGGLLAAATLAQAPVNTIAGALAIDPRPRLPGSRPLCAGIPSTRDHGDFRYGSPPPVNGFWTVGQTPGAPPEALDYIEHVLKPSARVEVRRVDAPARPDALVDLLAPHFARDLHAGVGDIASLPLIELPAAAPSSALAILLSGDGGWRDLDKTIAEQLQRDGIPVVGWDSVRYFWTRKTAQQTAADLGAVIDTYSARWHADRIALIGYSFGANVLPFAYEHLTPGQKRKVVLVSLLGLESRTDWEIQVTGWLGSAPSRAAQAVAPSLARMPPEIIQCFYGSDEPDTLCPSLAASGAQVIRTSGGHHFDGDYAALARRIVERLAAPAR